MSDRARDAGVRSEQARTGEIDAYWDALAVRYDRAYEDPGYSGRALRSRQEAVLSLLGDEPGDVLDAGMGPGRLLAVLSGRGWRVWGVDTSPQMVALAASRLGDAADQLTCASLEELPFHDSSFDAVVATGVLEYVGYSPRALAELARVLRPGGLAAISVPNVGAAPGLWRRRILYPVVRALKRIAPIRRPPPAPAPPPPRARRFDRLLEDAGLRVQARRYTSLSVPAGRLFPEVAERVSARLERGRSRLLMPLAGQVVYGARKRDVLKPGKLASRPRAGPILGVDASRAAGERLGVGRIMAHILRSWSGQPSPFAQIRVLSPEPIDGLPEDGRLMPEIIPAHGPGLWWQAARLRPRTRDLDAFFAPYFLPPGFRGRSVVYNFGIYEGRYAIPGWRAKAHSRHIAYSARRASLVLANCPTTKADLVSCYGIEPSNIRVLPEGRDPRFRPAQPGDESEIAQAAGQTLGTDDPYFLFVGKTSLRRHVRELLAAFAMAASSAPRIQLLLVGPNTTRVPIERIAGDLGVLDRVHHKPYLDHDVIRLLYRGARAFVTPSEKDGFPTTLLEALASGCPSITLRGASLGVLEFLDGPRDHAEGGPVLEAADASPASLAEVIGRLADDDELCVELGRRGERYASTFPAWEETAAVIMDALVEVAGGNGLRDAVTESWDPG